MPNGLLKNGVVHVADERFPRERSFKEVLQFETEILVADAGNTFLQAAKIPEEALFGRRVQMVTQYLLFSLSLVCMHPVLPNQALEATRDTAPARLSLGVRLMEHPDSDMSNEYIEKALICFNKSIELAPDMPESRYARARILKDIGRHDEAINDLDEAIRVAPWHVRSRCLKAEILMETGRPKEAVDTLTEGINEEPTSDELCLKRGLCYMETRDLDHAAEDFRAVVKLNPLRKDGHFFLGSVLWGAGKPQQALESLERTLIIDPQFTHALFQRSKVMSALGRHDDATRVHYVFLTDRIFVAAGDKKVPKLVPFQDDLPMVWGSKTSS